MSSLVCVAMALTVPQIAKGAAVQALIDTCDGLVISSPQLENGAWSEAASGPDTDLCTTGTGTYGGDVQSVQSEINANAVSFEDGTSYQSTLGLNTFTTETFVLEAQNGASLSPLTLTVIGNLTGDYDLRTVKSSTSAGATASATIGGSLFIGTVNAQDGYRESFRNTTEGIPTNTTFIQNGIVDEILSSSTRVTPGIAFDVRASAFAFGVGIARLNTFGEGASQAKSDVSAALSYTFDFIPEGYCLRNISTDASSCDTGGGGGGDPTDPPTPSEVPLPATGLLLLAGLAMLKRHRATP